MYCFSFQKRARERLFENSAPYQPCSRRDWVLRKSPFCNCKVPTNPLTWCDISIAANRFYSKQDRREQLGDNSNMPLLKTEEFKIWSTCLSIWASASVGYCFLSLGFDILTSLSSITLSFLPTTFGVLVARQYVLLSPTMSAG